jgi:hypothetical protein
MLVGDVTKEPPRGGSWKKRLLDQGTTANMLALLERCLEDDSADRPADAQVLAQELQAVIKQAEHQIKQGGHQSDPVPVPPSPEIAPKGLAEGRQLVKKPAIALLVVGILALLVSLIAICGMLLDVRSVGYRTDQDRMVGIVTFFCFLLLSVAAGVAILAGWSMLKLRWYWFCLVGSFAVMPAAGFCFLVGIPVGIWSLLTLCKAEVRSAFR